MLDGARDGALRARLHDPLRRASPGPVLTSGFGYLQSFGCWTIYCPCALFYPRHGTCCAISFSSIIRASIAAESYAVSRARRRGLRSCHCSTRSIIVLVDSTSCGSSRRRTLAYPWRLSSSQPDRSGTSSLAASKTLLAQIYVPPLDWFVPALHDVPSQRDSVCQHDPADRLCSRDSICGTCVRLDDACVNCESCALTSPSAMQRLSTDSNT